MPYVLKTSGDKSVYLPQELAGHLGGAGEIELKVILYICSIYPEDSFEDTDIAEMTQKLAIEKGDAEAAVAFWRGTGILQKTNTAVKKTKEKIPCQNADEPLYPAAQLAQAIESVAGMKNLVEFTQRRMGKVFNFSQLSTLYSFYDSLGFDTEIIMLAVEYCCGIEKKSLGYIQKVLISLSDAGIDTYTGAEEYFKKKREHRSNEGKVRTLCGISLRELTPSEKKIISTWFDEWNTDFSLIEKAYEITVDRTSKPSLKYMNAILRDWHDKGIRSVSDISQGEASQNAHEKSHDADDFFRAAVAKSMESGFGSIAKHEREQNEYNSCVEIQKTSEDPSESGN
ncbi:MAG: DnaD domain protein [Clostridia bacterium]|nr:DnaD domain protein [Clostridia bacterium]